MKIKTYSKTILREIKNYFGRFISLVLIVFLGTFIFVGVKTTQPILIKSADDYINENHLSDLQITSTGGFTDEDEQLVNTIKGVTSESAYQLFEINSNEDVVHYFSYDKEATQNKLVVTEGRLPKDDDEIVLDSLAKKKGYKLNESYAISSDSDLEDTNYKIVGFVDSPLFLSSTERGVTNIGDGNVDFFAYLPSSNFKDSTKSLLYLTFDNTKSLDSFSSNYQITMEKNEKNIKKILNKRAELRETELKSTAQDTLNSTKNDLLNNQSQIIQGKEALTLAKNEISQQKLAVLSLPLSQLVDIYIQLNDQDNQINSQLEELTNQENTIDSGLIELEEKQKDIDQISVKYLYTPRTSNVGFSEYENLGTSIASIANIFPIFFFLIAALISFTTTTRMIEENRQEIGTLKALGFKKIEIASKYIVYNILALVLGLLTGIIAGTEFIPRLVFSFSSNRFNINTLHVIFDSKIIIITIIAFLLSNLGSSLIILYKNLKEKPSILLQPKAPKEGKKIALEYITPLWSRLSFNQKISYRNLFRYKSRLIMAIVGIAGCTGLMVAGTGLKDSIGGVTSSQFDDIANYQAILTMDDTSLSDNSIENIESELSNESKINSYISINSKSLDIKKAGESSGNLQLFVFKDNNDVKNYINLIDKTGKALKLNKNGAIITQNFAHFYNISEGDTVEFLDSDLNSFKIKIIGITENYLGNYLYMTSSYYDSISNESKTNNAFLVKTRKMNEKQENQLSKQLIDTGKVSNVSYVSSIIEQQDETIGNMNAVVILFVILSGLLAFVVLYNLTNINIYERIRELSTIKVLGFYDREVTFYIVRENVIYTLVGILGGYGVGYILTEFILQSATMEDLTLPLIISPFAYILATVLTILFSVIVMFITHFKLKHIDMIEALKANE